jgi:hypothetical protein
MVLVPSLSPSPIIFRCSSLPYISRPLSVSLPKAHLIHLEATTSRPSPIHKLPRTRTSLVRYPKSHSIRTMASATTFYDFKPVDSMSRPLQYPPDRRRKNNENALLTQPQQQRKANPSTWPPSKAKSSSSSTQPPNAASPLNSKASRTSTSPSKPSTPKTSPFWASPATSSAAKTPAPTTRSRRSARSTTASPSPCWASWMSMAIMRRPCGRG